VAINDAHRLRGFSARVAWRAFRDPEERPADRPLWLVLTPSLISYVITNVEQLQLHQTAHRSAVFVNLRKILIDLEGATGDRWPVSPVEREHSRKTETPAHQSKEG
jgi:hypothetical protein